MNQSQWESPSVPVGIADAPDIDNVPAASSMHALMEAVVEMYHGVRQIQEHFGIGGPVNAPEPEPEWKPGTVADVEIQGEHVHRAVRTEGSYWAAENDWTYGDSEVTDVRPLVVVDPAAVDVDAIEKTYARAYVNEHLGTTARRAGILAVLAALGIEAS